MSDVKSTSHIPLPPSLPYDSHSPATRVNCPVRIPFDDALKSAEAFGKAIRLLRRSLLNCDQCSGVDECPIRKQVGEAIDIAIQEVTDEWGLCVD